MNVLEHLQNPLEFFAFYKETTDTDPISYAVGFNVVITETFVNSHDLMENTFVAGIGDNNPAVLQIEKKYPKSFDSFISMGARDVLNEVGPISKEEYDYYENL